MKRWLLPIGLITLALVISPELGAQQAKKRVAKPKSTPTAQQPNASTEAATKAQAEGPIKEDLKRLIMKDGSYQGVMKYQLVGDRVRYFSSERYDWEDIPNELID